MKNTRYALLIVSILNALICHAENTNEIAIQHLGKVTASSANGDVQLELFHVTTTIGIRPIAQYWIAKPYNHEALVFGGTNHIVVFGDKICAFYIAGPELLIYPGVTNIANPLSEEDIRQYFIPVFERVRQHQGMGIDKKSFFVESLLPKSALGAEPRTYGFGIKIVGTTVTPTNITLALRGERYEYLKEDQTNNIALFTFGTDLNLIGTRVITNNSPANLATNLPPTSP